MVQQNVADKLRQRRSPWRSVVAVGAIVLLGVAGVSVGTSLLSQPKTDEATVIQLVGGLGKPTTPQINHKLMTAHTLKSTTPPPPPEPEPVYVAPPSGGGGGSNSGALVPFIASSDPNNASGGDYLDPGSYCTSGSASGFPPRCD